MNQTRVHRISLFLLLFLTACCHPDREAADPGPPMFEIAFMPDVHFHDLFSEFETGSFEGLPAHIRGLAAILNEYREKHGINFFLTPGNHDHARPYATEAGKRDYLGEGGRRQPVFSRNHSECLKADQAKESDDAGNIIPISHSVACTDEVKEMGYSVLYEMLGGFGLTHQEPYLHYETPFSGSYNADNSLFMPENRRYEVCHEGSGSEHRETHFTNCIDVPDMSYLAEPVKDVWLLALDTNVYVPRADVDQGASENGEQFHGSGNAG